MKKPLLSVIIPVYNTGDVVSRITNRVLKQPMRDLELVLVDDGSTDDTLSVLHQIAKQDARVRVITQKNGGPSAARNTGLDSAKGEFVLLLDSDDDIESDMIPLMMEKQRSTNADLVTCVIKEIFLSGKTHTPNIESRSVDTAKQNVVLFALDSMGKEGSVIYNPCNRITRRSIIVDNHLKYRLDLRFGEDLAFNLEYLRYAKRIEVMNQALYIYHCDTATSVFSESALNHKYRQENTRFLWKFAKLSDDPAAHCLATWVQTRWFLSYAKLVSKSNLNKEEKKRRIIHACEHEKLERPAEFKYLSKKRQLIVKLILRLIKHPNLFYRFIKTVTPLSSAIKSVL
ncbi:glycosyltransferase [Candidatus Saccharibacteria bacterium]|nr:glycosyltransferase [Candidatus Saccharibacteria bacterium]